jgi:hypothetical protein
MVVKGPESNRDRVRKGNIYLSISWPICDLCGIHSPDTNGASVSGRFWRQPVCVAGSFRTYGGGTTGHARRAQGNGNLLKTDVAGRGRQSVKPNFF